MYISLYRKYRPKTFSRVIGQKYVVRALKNQIAGGKVGHAFIFTGTRGTGKTSCAKIFAKAVNCLNPHDGEPCRECDVCKGIENESIFDVTEMDAASNNSVEDIRDVLKEVNYLPVMAKYRVYIIDEVHMLTPSAFNALLKTLEEPPAHVIFILATTEIHKVPATILSRCQRYDFTKLTIEDISAALLDIAQKEGIDLTPPVAKMIASLSDGAMRDANSILDTCISAGGQITEDVVANIAGVCKDDDVIAFVDSLVQKDTRQALSKLSRLFASSVDMRRLCEEFITHLSNLMVAGLKDSSGALLNVSDEKFEKLKEQSAVCGVAFLSMALNYFTLALEGMTKGQNPKVAMDIAVFNICNGGLAQPVFVPAPAAAVNKPSNPSQTVWQKKRRTDTAPQQPKEQRTRSEPQKSEPEEKPRREKEPVAAADIPDRQDKPVEFSYWQQVIDQIADVDIPLHSFIKNSTAWLYKNVVYIKGSEGLNNYIRTNKEVNGIIKEAIYRVCGHRYYIGGFKNIAGLFAEKGHSTLDDILALREQGVRVDIKD